MNFADKFTKRLNVNICSKTYGKLQKVATMEGRKPGNKARQILNKWAMNAHEEDGDDDRHG